MTVMELNTLLKKTDHWGFVETPYGDLYLAGNDDGIAVRYVHGHEYEPESLAAWVRLCARAECVMDVGAHTGLYSLAAYQAGASRVISIEPYYLNMARLKMNLRYNGYAIHDCIYACASDTAGYAAFSTSRNGAYCSTGGRLGGRSGWHHNLSQVVTGDSLAPQVDLIKIDTEGTVPQVLRGMTRLLQTTPVLLLEATQAEVEDILSPLGYGYTILDERNLFCRVRP